MAKLIYAINMSLDGYFVDADGSFDWSEPSEEVHQFFNDLIRPIGTHVYGRRMYEVMAYWESVTEDSDEPAVMIDFAQSWQAADKIAVSRTLPDVTTTRTSLWSEFTPELLAELKATATQDVSIGGPELAGQAMEWGLVDEIHLVVGPVIVGGGARALPDNVRMELQLVNVDHFDSGAVHLHYAVKCDDAAEPTGLRA
jgi:dihydrofolate reductase